MKGFQVLQAFSSHNNLTIRDKKNTVSLWGLTMAVSALVCALVLLMPGQAFSLTLPGEFVVESGKEEQARVKAEFGEGFRVLETKHFRVISDTSIRYHTVITGTLEQFHELEQPRFFQHDMKMINFYLINGGRDYENFVRKKGFSAHASGYGFYDGASRSLYARRYFPTVASLAWGLSSTKLSTP